MRSRIIETLNLNTLSFLVPDFTFMLTLALILGALITLRQCRRHGFSEAHSYQAVFYAVLFVIPGARLVYFLQYPHHFSDLWDVLDARLGGLAFYGGLLGVVLAPSLYLWSQRVSITRFLDALVPALALGSALGRLGCFSAGCNWGETTGLPWGVRFPGPYHAYDQHLQAGLIDSSAPLSLPVHPTQLYEAAFGLIVLVLAYHWLRQPHQSGTIFLKAVSAYAVFRFALEFLRADAQGVAFGPLSFAQLISLIVVGTCLWFLWRPHYWLPPERVEAK